MNRLFGPKPADHPSVGKPCPACKTDFAAGDWTTLVAIGPGDDTEAQERAREGRPYTAVAIEAHWTCVTGEKNPGEQPSITCPQCGRTSYHPRDIAERYCGNCHQFHETMGIQR